MSKVLRTVGQVAGVVAAVASVAALVTGNPALAATLAKVSKIAFAVAAVATVGAQLTAKRPSSERGGLQLSFKIDPGGPIPYAMGRTAVGGTVVHRETYGTDNHYETWFVVLSHAGGAKNGIEGFDDFTADRVSVPFSGTAATGYFSNWMWQDRQLGASPEADALGHGVVSPPFGSVPGVVPGWSTAHKLSGYAASSWTLLFDTKARRYQNGEPDPAWIIKGVKVYDPRLDSTYPGGAGSCRWADPSDTVAHEAARATWVDSETPALHELKWALGIWGTAAGQSFRKIMGVGAPIDLVDVAAYVEAANVQEANGWKVGGQIDSAGDKWENLKLIGQAGGSEPIANGARLSTMVKAPRVSLGTITRDDLADGTITVPAMQPRRERINGFRPRFRSEAHGWEMVSTNLVQIADALAEDGAPRTASGEYALVQDADQAVQLGAYEILEARERKPITLPLKPRFAAYRIGDCLTLELEEYGIDGIDAVVRGRSIDPMTGIVTLTFATETAGKHAIALAQAGVVDPVPDTPDPQAGVPAPDGADWTLDASTDQVGIVFTGAVGNTNATQVVFSYRVDGETEWMGAGSDDVAVTAKAVGGLAANTAYEGSVQYMVRGQLSERLILGPVTTETELILDGNFF
jgi:hypothetical protein